MGFSRPGAFALLYLVHRPSPSQNWYRAPPRRRPAGGSGLPADGDGTEAVVVLEETSRAYCRYFAYPDLLTSFQRKCWWDGIDIEIPGEPDVKLWARRVWTLELSLVRLSYRLTTAC